MLLPNLNFFSLLIPLIMVSLGIGTLLLYQFKYRSNFLVFYAVALLCIGLSVFFHTILLPEVLLKLLPYIFFIYFLSCVLHAHAIYLRLGIQSNWTVLSILTITGLMGIGYFSWVDDNQMLRMLVIGMITASIYLNRPIVFTQLKPPLAIDRYLKGLTIALAGIALGRAILLNQLFVPEEIISSSPGLWASTQLMLIIIDFIFLGVFISCAIQEVMDQLKFERNCDPLTGLLNRRAFREYIQNMHLIDDQAPKALMVIDLDHFKLINDTYGHRTGDLALKHSSKIFAQYIGEDDRLSRVGGEEFVIILNNATPEKAIDIAEKLRSQLETNPLFQAGQIIRLSTSIGVSFFDQYQQFDDALQEADDYLYQAKKNGRNLVQSKFSG